MEYLIKAFEDTVRGALPEFLSKLIRKVLHGLFWVIAQSTEKKDIQGRFEEMVEEDRVVLDRILSQ